MRLIAEQADDEVRGWWDGDRFRLATTLSSDELERFFLRDYRPTPLVSPWLKGSGFFHKNDPGLHPLERSVADRFSIFRAGIVASRTQIEALESADQDVRAVKDEAKLLKKAERGVTRPRDGFKQDYENIANTIDKSRSELQTVREAKSTNRDRAQKRLEDLEQQLKDAEEYKKLLDERDSW